MSCGFRFDICVSLLQFSILSNPPPANEYPQIPATQALILDPWVEPLPTPGPAPYSDRKSAIHPEGSPAQTTTSSSESSSRTLIQDSRPLPRMLVLNSDRFTLWEDHFERLKGVVEAWEPEGRRVLTLGKRCQYTHNSTEAHTLHHHEKNSSRRALIVLRLSASSYLTKKQCTGVNGSLVKAITCVP